MLMEDYRRLTAEPIKRCLVCHGKVPPRELSHHVRACQHKTPLQRAVWKVLYRLTKYPEVDFTPVEIMGWVRDTPDLNPSLYGTVLDEVFGPDRAREIEEAVELAVAAA